MSEARIVIDITDLAALRQIADGARQVRQPVVLRAGEDDVAILVPIPTDDPPPQRRRKQERLESILSAFGGWKGLVDADQLKRDIYAARRGSRPLDEP